jgi:hypothetical protein
MIINMTGKSSNSLDLSYKEKLNNSKFIKTNKYW